MTNTAKKLIELTQSAQYFFMVRVHHVYQDGNGKTVEVEDWSEQLTLENWEGHKERFLVERMLQYPKQTLESVFIKLELLAVDKATSGNCSPVVLTLAELYKEMLTEPPSQYPEIFIKGKFELFHYLFNEITSLNDRTKASLLYRYFEQKQWLAPKANHKSYINFLTVEYGFTPSKITTPNHSGSDFLNGDTLPQMVEIFESRKKETN